MDPLATVASALTIIAIAVGFFRWAWSRKQHKPLQDAELAPTAHAGPSVDQKRAGMRLANNASAILTDLRYLAEQTKSSNDFQQRTVNVERWLREFTDDVKPHLHDLGDLEGEERSRRVYGDLAARLVPLLKTRPIWIMGVDDEEPFPGWIEQYKPIREGLPEHIKPLADVLRWAQDQAGLTPDGEWTEAEEKTIRDDYFRNHTAYCPRDGAQLRIMQDMTTSQSRLAMVFCPNCQRSAEGI